jgi:hypothetical protein
MDKRPVAHTGEPWLKRYDFQHFWDSPIMTCAAIAI